MAATARVCGRGVHRVIVSCSIRRLRPHHECHTACVCACLMQKCLMLLLPCRRCSLRVLRGCRVRGADGCEQLVCACLLFVCGVLRTCWQRCSVVIPPHHYVSLVCLLAMHSLRDGQRVNALFRFFRCCRKATQVAKEDAEQVIITAEATMVQQRGVIARICRFRKNAKRFQRLVKGLLKGVRDVQRTGGGGGGGGG